MADYLVIFLVTDIIFLALVVLLIWRDWSMPSNAEDKEARQLD